MMKKLNIPARALCIMIVLFFIQACGSSKKDSSGESAPAVGIIGFLECFNCHADAVNPAALRKVFGDTSAVDGWADSGHANGDNNPSLPLPADICSTCHADITDDIAGFVGKTGNTIFGTVNKPVIGCESCHGAGGNHFGLGPLGNDLANTDIFALCTTCHELDTFHNDDITTIYDSVITDTHIDDPVTGDIEGYILNPASDHSDLQGNTNSGTCEDCHNPHASNTINVQWAASGHAGFIASTVDGTVTAEPFASRDFATSSGGGCARCHTSTGFRNIANDPTNYDPANNVFVKTGLQKELIYCWACHSNNIGTVRQISPVAFPSGLTADLDFASNICMQCHQGRESGLTVANAIAANPGGPHSFINRHYLAAGAILFGTDVQAGYEYTGKTYVGQNTFAGHTLGSLAEGKNTCGGCHLRGSLNDHSFVPQVTDCSVAGCHQGITDFSELGLPIGSLPNIDYDEDGTGESFQDELDGLLSDLLAGIQTYASSTIGTWIIYSSGSYPYFFIDSNMDGVADPGEVNFGNRYNVFDDKLIAAAYNYHSGQDPCSDIHNHKYVVQTLIDSILDLNPAAGPYPNRP